MSSLCASFCLRRPTKSALILTLVLMACVVFAEPTGTAHARGGYASWLKHGNAYRVTGNFAGYKGSLVVQVKWRGNRFVIITPIGTFPLKRAGAGVTFRVRFEKFVARVTWVKTRADVVWKGKRGTAVVRKIDSRRIAPDRGNTLK